ncbi:hypothetical protein MJO28_015312 [Puccinia striiformis f. sp. tritici]|uniref:Tet-like 2OG-Fe(II) oxygenase domain-containing protein n=2 Tax=Puccinia striiformis f. sp. tritici TaxID=168172 RepID=A0A0L0V5D5_9BASI|nr:hypothetical protein MJO28_015312 [Puccinia striiformis f. sp. tritici]KNE94468.1 hypothetical protein PSTG_12191 [Puccinia striiformis f. sp. tritici PST-78]
MDPVIMDDDMESVLTDLSSESATNEDYPSSSELSEPPELNPISVEDDTDSLTSEDEDYDSDSTDSSEEDVPLSSLWTEKRSSIDTDEHSRLNCEDYNSDSTDPSESSEEDIPLSSYQRSPIDAHEHSTSARNEELGNSTGRNKRELTDKQQAAAKKRRNRNWSKKRSQRKLEETLENLTDLPSTCGSLFRDVRVVTRDFFPNITAETKEKKTQRRAARKFFKQFGGPKPSKEPIHPRNPTEAEISNAYKIVNDRKQFRLYSYGHVRIFDKALTKDKRSPIIADMHFQDLLKLEDYKRNDLNFLLAFLEESKKFVNVVGSEGRSCGGSMWAIGWRKSMTKLEIVGRYVNTEAIKKNQEAFDQHVQDSDKASEILWKLFQPIGNVALLANQQFMVEHNLPAFSDSQLPGTNSDSSKDFFSTNLTFTSNGFFNHPHKDISDEPKLPFAFLLVIPTKKSTGQLAFKSDGYDVTDGPLIFPDCGFGIEFKPNTMVLAIFAQRSYVHGTLPPNEPGDFTKVGMSMQIAQKTTRICDRILAEEFVAKPHMHVGDVSHILNKIKK